jgi:hypothetical protein
MEIQEVSYNARVPAVPVELAGIPDSLIDAAKQKILQSLQKKYPDREFDLDAIILERFSHVLWNDSSLDCPDEGKFYEQVLTPGYQIHFSVGNQWITMHTDATGQLIVSPNFELDTI